MKPLTTADVPPRDQRTWVTLFELVDDTGITYRQADYWVTTGLLATLDAPRPGSGRIRRLDPHQIDRAHALKALLDSGVSLPVARQVVDDLVTTGTATHRSLTFTLNQPGDAA